MRLGGAASALADAGHDVEAVASWSSDPGDREIFNHAFQASQVIITIDKDFGEPAVVLDCLTEASFVSLASRPNDRERPLSKLWPSTQAS